MPLAGIIAEFNPFHNGHNYLVNSAKKDGFDVAAVISGNFVQRGDVAICPKFKRAEMAISSGVDIVLELPVPWSMSTAQKFALGGISQLANLGIDTLYFGSECADINELCKISEILNSESFIDNLNQHLKSGKTFAKIRCEAVEKILGYKSSVLESPNDTLAVEYISAAKNLNLNINFKPIKRIGANHNDLVSSGNYSTATLLRQNARESNIEYLKTYMPEKALEILLNSPIADISRLDTAIIASIKKTDVLKLSHLPDISEGIEHLIIKHARKCFSYAELCEAIKSKRYTMARIRRILLSAFLEIDNSFSAELPPYVRVLGFKKEHAHYLSKTSNKPIITKVSQIGALDEFSKRVLDLENRINDIYSLALNDPSSFVSENSEKIIIKE